MHRIGGNFNHAAQWRLKFSSIHLMHWRVIQLLKRRLMKNKTRPRKAPDTLAPFLSWPLHVNDHITGSLFSDISLDICLSRIVSTQGYTFFLSLSIASILAFQIFLISFICMLFPFTISFFVSGLSSYQK